ncbi:hypothetical protein AGR4A_pAt30067 [Agrobacterium tumefaciens str. B6]|uniref:Uncharacterized protein n=1 Tax=Agrobacterium tumefaciens str. B6 TaxID=1183423 RepID=A0A822VDN0_AGRTU|nr:hypothetical protein AGR4A_pAt30067 [Agrobacterium tumefaciens str. B6]
MDSEFIRPIPHNLWRNNRLYLWDPYVRTYCDMLWSISSYYRTATLAGGGWREWQSDLKSSYLSISLLLIRTCS